MPKKHPFFLNLQLLINKFILPDKSLVAFWKMEESEDQLRALCNLTEEDNILINQCKSVKRRIELLSVRALLKYVGISQTIHYNDRKPYMANGYISISHSADIAAIIWNKNFPVGIDVETTSERVRRISKRAFSDEEIAAADDNIEMLTVLWNCKECIFKLVNDEGVDFREMINVSLPQKHSLESYTAPSSLTPIECFFKKSEKTTRFHLLAMKIEDNTAVFGNNLYYVER